ncbi:MAG: dienelactone hydrolase family protein [Corticimicrobacter sp.]|uniref:alpha/beta hydrolase n=1 Tax=Corticimicrobacter sp. TaxID=2678536 RepID=UPI0032DAAD52
MTQSLLDAVTIDTGTVPQRTVIWLHGLGADGHDFAPIVPELGLEDMPPIRFIFPHAGVMPVTINNGMAMRAWYDILGFNGTAREDDVGIHHSQAAVEALIAQEKARGVPARHIVLAGFSQGCAMTLQVGLRHAERLGGLIALSGYLPLRQTLAAERSPANADVPILQAHGTQDPVVAIQRAETSRALLEELGYHVEWHTYPMPHSVCAQEIAEIGTFLKRVLA